MPETEDLYEILHLHPSAHPDVIQAAYRRLALLYHPDKNPSPEATEMMAAVNCAHEVLSDPEQRAEYDRCQAAQIGSTASGAETSPSAASASQSSRPSNAPRNPTGYFTLGSTKMDIRLLHGNPFHIVFNRALDRESWYYSRRWNDEGSWHPIGNRVDFSLASGLVMGWYGGYSLKARMIPGTNVTSLEYFTYDSHKDEVVRLQGTPKSVLVYSGKEEWQFDDGTIDFSLSSGSITTWKSSSNGGLKALPRNGNSSVSSPRTQTAQPSNNWMVVSNEYNKVVVTTRDPVNPEYSLMVGIEDGRLDLFVSWRKKISYSGMTLVNFQIDDGPTWSDSWYISSEGTAIILPSQNKIETIRALSDATEFTVRVYPFGGSPITAKFDVRGSSGAIGLVLEAWRHAVSSAPSHTAQAGGGCFLLPVASLSALAGLGSAIWFLL